MSSDTLRKLLASIMIARAGYAISLFVVIMLFRFDVANPANITGNFAALMQDLPLALVPVWAIYLSGYLAAGIFVFRSSQIALWVFGAAMVTDMSLWIYVSIQPSYQHAWAGTAQAVDMFFNILDLAILISLAALAYLRALR